VNEEYAVVLVHSTSHAIRGERLLSGAGVPCRLIPVPRYLSSDCGSCIRIKSGDSERAESLLRDGGVGVEAVKPYGPL